MPTNSQAVILSADQNDLLNNRKKPRFTRPPRSPGSNRNAGWTTDQCPLVQYSFALKDNSQNSDFSRIITITHQQ